MSKGKSQINMALPTLDDLFTTQEERDDMKLERVKTVPISELRPFKDHPFKILNNEDMDKLIESVKKYGVLTPALARPLPDGEGYELVSGHRRLAACELLDVEEMPVIIREMTDDEAVIAMVDANLQRESILPSEKAFAYRMKLEALRRQGHRTDLTSTQVGQKLLSVEKVGQNAGDSRSQVQRYIRLTFLIPELLDKVDQGEIAFNPAVELSFLTEKEQSILFDSMERNDCTPSHAQAIRLKKFSIDGELTEELIHRIMSETKPNQQEHIKFPINELRKYFPAHYTQDQMKKDVLQGLKLLEQKRERSRNAR